MIVPKGLKTDPEVYNSSRKVNWYPLKRERGIEFIKIEADFLRTSNWQEGLPSQKEGIFSQPLRRNIDYNDYSLSKLLHNLYSQASFVVWAEHYSRRRAWEGHRLRQVSKFYWNTSLIISPVSGHCVSLQCCEDLEHTWRGNWTGKELINLICTSL